MYCFFFFFYLHSFFWVLNGSEKSLCIYIISFTDSEHDLQELMVKWKQYASQLKDELRSTTENYETQLSVMSEHLVDLNMDLNEKREAIESFNLQLSNKVRCQYIVYSSFCD